MRIIVAASALMMLTACANAPDGQPSASGAASTASPSVQNLHALAQDARARGHKGEAQDFYEQILALDNSDREAVIGLSRLYRETGKADQAVKLVEEALNVHKEDEALRSSLGYAELAAGKSSEAEGVFKTLLEQGYKTPGNYNGYALALDHAGNHKEAQETYAQGLAASPNSGLLANNYALSKLIAGDAEGAAKDLKALLARKDNGLDKASRAQARQNLALAYGVAGQEDQAKEIVVKDLDEKSWKTNQAFYRAVREKHASLSPSQMPMQAAHTASGAPVVFTPPDTAVETVSAQTLEEPSNHKQAAVVVLTGKPAEKKAVAEKKTEEKPAAKKEVVKAVTKKESVKEANAKKEAAKKLAAKEDAKKEAAKKVAAKEDAAKKAATKEAAIKQEKAKEKLAEKKEKTNEESAQVAKSEENEAEDAKEELSEASDEDASSELEVSEAATPVEVASTQKSNDAVESKAEAVEPSNSVRATQHADASEMAAQAPAAGGKEEKAKEDPASASASAPEAAVPEAVVPVSKVPEQVGEPVVPPVVSHDAPNAESMDAVSEEAPVPENADAEKPKN